MKYMKYQFSYNGDITSWNDEEEYFGKIDSDGDIRLTPEVYTPELEKSIRDELLTQMVEIISPDD